MLLYQAPHAAGATRFLGKKYKLPPLTRWRILAGRYRLLGQSFFTSLIFFSIFTYIAAFLLCQTLLIPELSAFVKCHPHLFVAKPR